MVQRTATTTLIHRRPLLVTDDRTLLDDLLDIAARCGADLDVAPDLPAARTRYPQAPLVLVGLGAAQSCGGGGVPRRPGVVLISRDNAADPPWRAAELVGAEHVAILPAAGPWLADRIIDAVRTGEDVDGRIVTVMGGRGGAGASVVAAGLAVTGARAGLRALLVDADPLGGGVDLVLGWESIRGIRWPALSETTAGSNRPRWSRPYQIAVTLLCSPGTGVTLRSCQRRQWRQRSMPGGVGSSWSWSTYPDNWTTQRCWPSPLLTSHC